MKLETKNTDALFYELNNFHLVWKKYLDEDIAKKQNRSEYALFYNNCNMWEIYSAGSSGMDYENKTSALYKESVKEIDNNLLLLKSKEDRIPYLKRILLKFFYIDDASEEPVTYLSIQEDNVQFNINWLTGNDFMADGGCNYKDLITISVAGFDGKEFKNYSYSCLLEQEECEYLTKEETERSSFVKTILSIKKKVAEKLEQQIKKLIEIEQRGKETESDIAFIQGGEINFETFTDSNTNNKKGYFKIEKNNEIRKYDPVQYLGLIKKGHYELADKTVSFRGKMSLFKNAELLIRQCVREYDLNKIECDFSKIFEDLKDQIEYLKANKELGFVGDEDAKPNQPTDSKTSTELENTTLAEKYLFFLSGKSQSNERYMSEEEYKRVIEYTNYLFDKFELPKKIEPIKSVEIKAGEIRYAFYLMLNERQPDKDYPKVVFDFMCKVFPKLKKGTENKNYRNTANYKKFRTKPQYWDSLIKR